MTQKKKPTGLAGLAGKISDYSATDSTAGHPVLIAHPARSMSGTGHFCTETARVQQQTDAEWLAEYDAADPLVKPGVSGIVGEGANHTKSEAASLPVSEAFPHPDFIGLGVGRPYPQGRAQRFGAVIKPHVHSFDLISQRMVFDIPEGIKAMNQTPTGASAQTTHAPSTGNTHHDHHHQAELLFRASNHLALALHQLRNATGDQGIKTAAGRANAAARALNQLAGGARHG